MQWAKPLALVVVGMAVVAASVVSVVKSNEKKASSSGSGEDYCTVVGTDFAWAVQGGLLCVAVTVLAVKRYNETPLRPWRVFLMDAGKQGVSSGAAHFCGMVSTLILAHATEERLECAWYMTAFSVDTTFGVFVAYKLLQKLESEAARREWPSLAHTGNYKSSTREHDPVTDPDTTVWLKQLAAFTVIVIFARAASITLITALLFPLDPIMIGITSLFDGHPKLFLVLVMMIGPGCLNIMQWWVQDNFLKKQNAQDDAAPSEECEDLLALRAESFDTSFMNDALEIGSDMEA